MTPTQLARALASLAPPLQRALLAQLAAWRAAGQRAALRDVEAAVAAGNTREVVQLLLGAAVATTVTLGPPALPDAATAFAVAIAAAIAAASRTEAALIRAAAEAAIQASRLASAALPPIPPTGRLVAAAGAPSPFSGLVTITRGTLPATGAPSAVRYGGDALRYLRATAHQGIVAAVQAGNAAGINPRDIARGLRDVVGLGESQAVWVANLRRELESGQFSDALQRKLLKGPIRQTVAARARSGKPLTAAEVDRIVSGYADKWRAWHAETIARTTSLDLLRTGTIAQARAALASGAYGPGATMTKRWVAFLDAETRDAHRALNGTTIDLNARWLDDGVPRDVPGGWNCYTGDTVVRGSPVLLLRSWYEGPVVDLVLAGGSRLTVTPNHPVLTTNGFAPAGSLGQRHYVLCDSARIGGGVLSPLADDDDDDCPPTIEQVWHAAGVDGRVRRRQLAGVDFHGDAVFTDGNVEVVSVNGHLLHDRETVPTDRGGDWRLERVDEPQSVLPGSSPLLHNLIGIDGAASGSMDAVEHGGALASLQISPLQPLGIGSPAYGNRMLAQPPLDRATTRPVTVGDRLERLASIVRSNDGGHINHAAVHGFTPQRVWSSVQRHHVGWVYDTMTDSGLQSANNITVSNCRCSVVIRLAS